MKFKTLSIGALFAIVPLAAAHADRPATAEERAAIERVLQQEGFTAWSDIDYDDDGYFEVDDAIAADGREYDLKLDASYAIIERDAD